MDFFLFNISPALLFPAKEVKFSAKLAQTLALYISSHKKHVYAQLNIFLIKREGGRRAAVD
jgi:hypothetical protein